LTYPQDGGRRGLRRWTRNGWTCAAAGIAACAGAAVVVPVAAQAATTKTEAVAKVVTRAPFGKMLATEKGASLYTTASACTASCLTIWPPLLMAKGKTTPTGVSGLSTVKVTIGKNHDLQVTYKGKRLYTFISDHGTSVTGNGVGGFKAAKVA
jgi:predicted lipoprotein with Yx(FWY)xxD motif